MREVLSAGTGGETWRAHDSGSNREVVLKVSKDGKSVRSVSDYIEGSDLSVLRGQDWPRVVAAAAQVAEALAALHARGSVHRDLKSSNVILKPDGSIALIDPLESDGAALSPYSASPQHYRGEPPTPADDAYAFGVLLYELLGGYPPFFPDITRERVLAEAPPVLKPAQPIPAALQDLTMRLLAKKPEERPGDLGQVAAALRKMMTDAGPVTAEQTATAAGSSDPQPAIIVRPILRPVAERRAAAADARTGSGLRVWFVGLAFAVLAAIVIGVFVFLPRYVPQHVVKAPVPSAPAPAQPAAPAPLEEIDYLALAEAMDKAEQARNAYEALYKIYEPRGAQQWAAASFSAARAQGEEGRRQFEKREYVASEQSYKEGLASLQEVANIAKRNEEAARQAKAQAEARKATEAAAERARVAANEFATGMSEGMRLLAAGKFEAARAALNRAGRARPNAPEVTEALGQIAQAEQRQKIASVRQRAEAAEASERWADAMAEYEAAIHLDSSLEFARTGRDRVRPRLALHEQLDQIVTKPERLLSVAVRRQAHHLLAQARQVASPGPVLQQQTARVTEQLKQAEMPVKVALESDSATDVVINRVTRLGAFASREVELLPGNYTVVGTRPGFRDVRRELAVLPGKPPAKLTVRCEEPI